MSNCSTCTSAVVNSGFSFCRNCEFEFRRDGIGCPTYCVVWGPKPDEQVLTEPPFLSVEILSPEDRMSRMQERIDDYLRFGVRYVWVIDPGSRRAWVYAAGEIREVRDEVLRTESPEIAVPMGELFE